MPKRMKENNDLLKLHGLYFYNLIFSESFSLYDKKKKIPVLHINSNLCIVLVIFIYKITIVATVVQADLVLKVCPSSA